MQVIEYDAEKKWWMIGDSKYYDPRTKETKEIQMILTDDIVNRIIRRKEEIMRDPEPRPEPTPEPDEPEGE